VAGTIAAVTDNGVGVAGVAYGSKIVVVRALGKCGGYDSDISDGIVWAAGGSVPGIPANAHPARVLNLSLGGYGACGTTYQNAINSARSRGAVVVVAAGNSADDASNYSPANCAGVIAVAATDRYGALAPYSNYGTAVQMAGPGGDMSNNGADGILSTLNTGLQGPVADSYAYYQGTSMASPHVAGVAALMLSVNPALTPSQLAVRLRSSARPFPQSSCTGCGAGIVDAYWAASMATATSVLEMESNNTLETAQLITPASAAVSGVISATSDVDYYKIALGAGKSLKLSVAPTLTTRDFDLYLLNSSGRLLRSSERSSGQTDRIVYTNTGSSTVNLYAKVAYYGGGTGAYTLFVKR
jgi:serine protease